MILNIITPLSRPENVSILERSVTRLANEFKDWDVRWYVMRDRNKVSYLPKINCFYLGDQEGPGTYGHPGRNIALDIIKEGYIWFLDDDNDIHPEFAPSLSKAIQENPDGKAFLFEAVRADGTTILKPHPKAGPGEIDTVQTVWHIDAIGTTRWDVHVYGADYYFFRDITEKIGPPIVTLGKVYYNKLRK